MPRKPVTVSVNIPFPGFYESLLSGGLDREEESFVEYRTDESEGDHGESEARIPAPFRLNADELSSLVWDCMDYGCAHLNIARQYLDAFDYWAAEALEITARRKVKVYRWETSSYVTEVRPHPTLRLAFEEMTSPREYNFATDRIFALVPLSVMRDLFRRSRAEGHATLAAVIARRFTSRSGFISHYPNDLDAWTAKPLAEWDYNELGTLLIAALEMVEADSDDFPDSEAYEAIDFYSAFDAGMDWQKYDSKLLDARREKLDALKGAAEAGDLDSAETLQRFALQARDNPGSFPEALHALRADILAAYTGDLPPARCDLTLEMFPETLPGAGASPGA